jgi:outer membrane protein assembly factor BamE (lipoprotein component of BamABCDE complex)
MIFACRTQCIVGLAMCFTVHAISGCAAMMGNPGSGPDLANVQLGATREEVESVLGSPIE